MFRPFLLKTSILMNLFYFKIPAGYKSMNSGRQWHKTLGVDMFRPFQLKASILMNLLYFKIPARY